VRGRLFATPGRRNIRRPGTIIPWVLLGTVAVGLKYYYSHATGDDLAWVLRPTAGWVARISGLPFVSEAGTGFVNRAHRIIVAPACAGLNFMIVALLTTGTAGLHRLTSGWMRLAWIGLAVLCAYPFTLMVNTVRIIGAIHLYSADIYQGWLTPARAHRMEGIGVYITSLMLYHLAVEYALCAVQRRSRHREAPVPGKTAPASGWTPMVWYMFVAIGVPLITGAPFRYPARFLEHGATIMLACALVFTVLFLLRLMLRQRHPAPRVSPAGCIDSHRIPGENNP